MPTSQSLWILGAADHEMAAIERLLTEAGQRVAYATAGGVRVHPGNAYAADLNLPADTDIICVECDFRGPDALMRQDQNAMYEYDIRMARVRHVDHHRPGDPGYGKPPAEYLEGSSIGQVMAILGADGWAAQRRLMGEVSLKEAADHIRLVAAADHCLGAAYAGQCPGVDPVALRRFRVAEKATFQGRSVEAVDADIEAAVLRLQNEQKVGFHGTGIIDLRPDQRGRPCWNCGCENWYEFPSHCLSCGSAVPACRPGVIPELPEAACIVGVAYMTTVVDPPAKGGRTKDVLGGLTTPETVMVWMAARWAEGREVYGDPTRGFAGAYVLA